MTWPALRGQLLWELLGGEHAREDLRVIKFAVLNTYQFRDLLKAAAPQDCFLPRLRLQHRLQIFLSASENRRMSSTCPGPSHPHGDEDHGDEDHGDEERSMRVKWLAAEVTPHPPAGIDPVEGHCRPDRREAAAHPHPSTVLACGLSQTAGQVPQLRRVGAAVFAGAAFSFHFRLAVMLVGHASGGDKKKKEIRGEGLRGRGRIGYIPIIPRPTGIVCGPLFWG